MGQQHHKPQLPLIQWRSSVRSPRGTCAALMALAMLTGSLLSACGHPVADDQIDALGPEAEGVEADEFHRPGQPCMPCHSSDGNAETYSVAGTVYADKEGRAAAPNVNVVIFDTAGKKWRTKTNRVGNFFVKPEDFDPVYPFWTSVYTAGSDGTVETAMETRVFREGACAFCHGLEPGTASIGPVYVELPGGAQ